MNFPGGPGVRIACFHYRGMAPTPGWGTKILQAPKHGQKKKKMKFSV